MSIDITGLKPAAVLAALYNASRPQGMGFLQYNPSPMTEAHAEALLNKQKYFDYLLGRVMKIEITNPLETRLYDRDNGPGAAEEVIAALRYGFPEKLTARHETGKRAAADEAMSAMHTPSGFSDSGMFVLGLSDVADVLTDAIGQAFTSND